MIIMKKITLLILLLTATVGFAQGPTTAAPTPTQAPADVVSIFSDAYSDITVNEFSTGWDNADVTDGTAGGNAVKVYTLTGGAFIGIQLGGATDLSGMENFHVDVWINNIDAGDVLLPKLANFAGGAGSVTNEVEFTYAFAPTDAGTWVSIDAPLSSFNVVSGGSSAINEVLQIVFGSSATLAGATLYLDNLYFWKTASSTDTDATLSDLQVDGMTVTGFSPTTYDYNVELPAGTTAVPAVTATATQAGNGASAVNIADAGALPGTTIVTVTAPDGTTTQPYNVNFTVASAGPTTAAPTPPARAEADVISIFSDAYTDVAVSEFSTGWDNADVTDGMAGGNAVKVYSLTGGAFIGIQLGGPNDLSGMTHFHVDVWIDNIDAGDVLLPKLANFAGGAGSVTNEVEFTYAFAPTDAGTWVSIDTMLSNFNIVSGGSDAISEVLQIVFGSSATLAGATVYLDNLYFHKNTTLSTADERFFESRVYPNPASDAWTISTPNNIIRSVQVFNVLGKSVATVFDNDSEASVSVQSLPSGIYLARITTDQGVKTLKLIRE
jgi:hypothetical protein